MTAAVAAHPFLEDLRTTDDLNQFLSNRVLEATPGIFGSDRTDYLAWRTFLAGQLDVDPMSLIVVGSCATGVSLNPHKSFKSFDALSDVDLAVVSDHHFDIAWRWYRTLTPTLIWRLPKVVRKEIYDGHAAQGVYFGSVATDRVLAHLPFGPKWVLALEEAAQTDPTVDRSISVRLYRDVGALRSYQYRSLKQARDLLLERDA